MIASAKAKYLRIPPRKVGLVINLIRGKGVVESESILANVQKRSGQIIGKVLHSAVSNAKQKGLTEEQLFVSKITADQGPSWKRFRAVTFGRANPILKRTTHLAIELDLRVEKGKVPLAQVVESKIEPKKEQPKHEVKAAASSESQAKNKPIKRKLAAK